MASSFTETFDSEKGAPGLGSFTIEFRPGTQHILGPHVTRTAQVAGGPTYNWRNDTLVVTSTDLGPSASRSDILSAALFSGRIEQFGLPIGVDAGGETWSISGPSILAWWGGGDPAFATVGGLLVEDATKSLALLLLLCINNHQGLTYSVDASVSSNALGVEFEAQDPLRDFVNKAIRATTDATEYRCSPAGSIIFAARGDDAAFRQTPQVMFTSQPITMRDGDLWCFQVSGRVEFDYSLEALSANASDATHSYISDTDFGDRLYYDFGGTNVATESVKFGDRPENNNLNTSDQLASVFCRKERMSLQVQAYSLKNYMNAGDHVWVNCPEAFLEDAAENINCAGEETHPIKLRSSGMTCPVRDTHGVYVIHNATQYGGENATERLNDYVEFAGDADPARVEFDPAPPMRKLVNGRAWRPGFAI